MTSTDVISEQQALAVLLSNAELREQFRRDPHKCLSSLCLSSELQRSMLQLDPGQLDAQAHTLLGKRWRAVCELIPESSFANPALSRERFMVYANHNWPAGHRRHERDALAFLQHCQSAGIAISRAELRRLELRLGKRFVSLISVRVNLGRGKSRPGLLLQYRSLGTAPRELLIRTI